VQTSFRAAAALRTFILLAFLIAFPGRFANRGFDETMRTMIAHAQRGFASLSRFESPSAYGAAAPWKDVIRLDDQRMAAHGNP
jgi:hypothetical protein